MLSGVHYLSRPDNARHLVALLHEGENGLLEVRTIQMRWQSHMPQTAFALIDANAPTSLDQRLLALADDIKLDSQHLSLIAIGRGVDIALSAAVQAEKKIAAVIGFSARFERIDSWTQKVRSRPSVFLVHGALDALVPPPEFMSSFEKLGRAGLPTFTCFQPDAGPELQAYGVDSAMYFLHGVTAALPLPATKQPQSREELAKSIKAIIWDLDDTLWDGTLDDVGDIKLKEFRVEAIRRLNGHGLISAICSKNDFEIAKAKLESLGLWDDFVFPRINFVPKGAALKSMIDDMQLRPKNCLFIDDNAVNLAEAVATLPDLNVLDATSEECDLFLHALLEAHGSVTKSRVEDYRALQNRVTESQQHEGSREEFLHSCDIHIVLVESADLMDFAPRIEELINRTNQLNFLKTRVKPGEIVALLSEPSLYAGFALFAWDKFGYHGLVGFMAVETRTKRLLHMAFSCRIMHMGMESFMLAHVLQRYPALIIPEQVSMPAGYATWIKLEDYHDAEIREMILRKENSLEVDPANIRIRFMAHCHSGVFAHFSGLRDVAEVDNFPRIFALPLVLTHGHLIQNFPDYLVYYNGIDYMDKAWRDRLPEVENGLYEQCAETLAQHLAATGKRMLVLTTPSDLPDDLYWLEAGVTRQRVETFNAAWHAVASRHDCIDMLDVESLIGPEGMVDSMHFKVEASQVLAKEIANWYAAQTAADESKQRLAS
ncbi:HAD-IIIC family phosphatase [Rhizobium oryzicola]|uniref:HAD-IIIC family phosphatase n=1 Tax=Rhizobium oryzicola TaxID=1232668 RepID=A0ABT8SV68_9HYPH|nr:HAD-IIIC family phosphatase [Rhizobium oryzicola]MDO1582200.1 HAD-IIIC family phosphatase [Rhizobium oryzicola]